MNKFGIVGCLIIALYSCHSNEKFELKKINYQTNIIDTSLIDSLIYIPLMNQEALGRIDNIIVKNQRFYILDDATMSISVFDTSGIFKYSIRNYGKGPDEYLSIYDYSINEFNDLIIWDNLKTSLIIYDQNGKFKKALKLGIHALNCAYIGKDKFAFYNIFEEGMVKNCISVYDLSTKALKDHIKPNSSYNQYIFSPTSKYNFHYSSNGIFLNEPYTNLIYEFKDGNVNKMFEFLDEGENPIDAIPKNLKEKEIPKILHNNTFGLYNFFETKNFFMISLLKEGKYLDIFISKLSGKSSAVILLRDPRYFGTNIIGVYDDWFIGYLEGYRLENYWDEFLKTKKVEIKNYEYIEKNKNDNCNFLVLIKLREF